MKPDLTNLLEKWPSTIVARENVGIATGGGIMPRHIANLDCRGEGPPGRFRVGRKVCYDLQKFIAWLESRSELVE